MLSNRGSTSGLDGNTPGYGLLALALNPGFQVGGFARDGVVGGGILGYTRTP